jgi:hypothetical protein
MKKMVIFIVVLLLSYNNADSQSIKKFFKQVTPVILNPIGTASKEVVKEILDNETVAQVLNPTEMVVDAAVPAVEQWSEFTKTAIKKGSWKDLQNSFNPWFIEAITAVNIMKQNGVIKNQFDCEKVGSEIAVGVAVGAQLDTGDPEIAKVLEEWTKEFSKATCGASFYQYSDGSYGISEVKVLEDGTVYSGKLVDESVIKNNPVPIAEFTSHSAPQAKTFLYSNGNVHGYAPGSGTLSFQGAVKRDPTGNFFLIFTNVLGESYGVDWNGDVKGIKENRGNVGKMIFLKE